jgi:AmmeMemoRadiSam system protein B
MTGLTNDLLLKGIAAAADEQAPPYRIAGGITSHHQLASALIARFFHRLAFQKIRTLVILGPNHDERGNADVSTSWNDWPTPFGQVASDAAAVREIVARSLAAQNDEILAQDQALTALLPYISYYLPGVKIVPLLFKYRTTAAELDQLTGYLTTTFKSMDTVFIASVDFSHYLSPAEADTHDAETISLIRQKDYARILRLNSDNLDSPPSLVLLLKIMSRLQAETPTIVDHTNSAMITGSFTPQTTSYIMMDFH